MRLEPKIRNDVYPTFSAKQVEHQQERLHSGLSHQPVCALCVFVVFNSNFDLESGAGSDRVFGDKPGGVAQRWRSHIGSRSVP
jgi:hypothetical protein